MSLCGTSHIQTTAATLVLGLAPKRRGVNFIITRVQVHISGSRVSSIVSKPLSWSEKNETSVGLCMERFPPLGETIHAPVILRWISACANIIAYLYKLMWWWQY